MKKLAYMLSLAIGLSLTGCATWDNYDPLAPDTWGAVSELKVEAPDTVTTDVLPITVITKNATNLSLLVSDTAMNSINYTSLLQAQYENSYASEVKAAGDTVELTMEGVEPGNTYYLYVVAANSAGVQTTYNKAIGAVDVEAPYITSVLPLTASNKGRTVTISFNEPIVREGDGLGAVRYNVYDADLNVLFNGNVDDANLVASGTTLTVTLPESVVFADDTDYFVVLSFEEGAVTDVYGNKMAAVAGGIDEEGLPHGPWWMVNNSSGNEDTGFIKEGNYLFSFTWQTNQGSQPLASTAAFEHVGPYDMSQIDPAFAGITAHQWSISNFLVETGLTPMPFDAFSYVDVIEGTNYNCLSVMRPDLELLQVGTVVFEGSTTPAPVYMANLVQEADGSYIYPDLLFAELQGQLLCVSDQPVLVTPSGQQYGIIALLNDMVITSAGEATVADAASVANRIKKFDMATAQKVQLKKKM